MEDGAPYVCEAIKVLALSDDPAATARDVRLPSRRPRRRRGRDPRRVRLERRRQGHGSAQSPWGRDITHGDGRNRGRPQRRGDAPGRPRRRRDGERYGGGQNGRRRRLAVDERGLCVARELDALLALPAALAAPALARRLRGRTKKIRRGASRSGKQMAPRAPVPDRVGRVPRGPAAVLRTRGGLGAPGLRVPRHGGGAAAIYALARAAAACDGRGPVPSLSVLCGGDVGRDDRSAGRRRPRAPGPHGAVGRGRARRPPERPPERITCTSRVAATASWALCSGTQACLR